MAHVHEKHDIYRLSRAYFIWIFVQTDDCSCNKQAPLMMWGLFDTDPDSDPDPSIEGDGYKPLAP